MSLFEPYPELSMEIPTADEVETSQPIDQRSRMLHLMSIVINNTEASTDNNCLRIQLSTSSETLVSVFFFKQFLLFHTHAIPPPPASTQYSHVFSRSPLALIFSVCPPNQINPVDCSKCVIRFSYEYSIRFYLLFWGF